MTKFDDFDLDFMGNAKKEDNISVTLVLAGTDPVTVKMPLTNIQKNILT